MADTPETTEPTTTEPTVTPEPVKQDDQKPKSALDELPEWARKELTDTRAEAANYRTRLREAESRLAEAKTPEDVERAVADIKATNEKLERDLLVATVGKGLPDDLLGLLGESSAKTEDELKAKAETLRKYASANTTPPPPGDLSGGLDPSNKADAFDPAEIARRARYGLL
ncbi:hypothetical protein [Plantactinospora sp. WMMB782]|uniref:hypothetical protein n=1 Tax=Plantactinospora sp. WMMB782 TaxID=3404121 RepID=UPI003B95704F